MGRLKKELASLLFSVKTIRYSIGRLVFEGWASTRVRTESQKRNSKNVTLNVLL